MTTKVQSVLWWVEVPLKSTEEAYTNVYEFNSTTAGTTRKYPASFETKSAGTSCYTWGSKDNVLRGGASLSSPRVIESSCKEFKTKQNKDKHVQWNDDGQTRQLTALA